jgi:hypothetical protein
MGSIKIAHAAPQGYDLDPADVGRRFEQAFGRSMP